MATIKRSERMKVLINIQQDREQQALEQLAEGQKLHQAQQAQLQNLQSYRQEYLDKMQAFNQQHTSVANLMEFRAFISKLDAAIETQQQTVEQCRMQMQQLQKAWEEQYIKRKSLTKVGENALKEELKIIEKQEQKEQDARAARYARGGKGL